MKFFYLQDHRVRLSAISMVSKVTPVGNRAGEYAFEVMLDHGYINPTYKDEATAVAVRAELMKELDRDAEAG